MTDAWDCLWFHCSLPKDPVNLFSRWLRADIVLLQTGKTAIVMILPILAHSSWNNETYWHKLLDTKEWLYPSYELNQGYSQYCQDYFFSISPHIYLVLHSGKLYSLSCKRFNRSYMLISCKFNNFNRIKQLFPNSAWGL